MNGQLNLDDLILEAAQPENDAAVSRLLKEIQNADPKLLKESAASFEILLDTWDESIYKSEEKATVCLVLAEKSVLDSSIFRIALNSAIRKFLPPYISSPAVAKAVGARDNSISVSEVAQRIRKLQRIKTNAYIYQMESRIWGRIINIDRVSAQIAISTFATGGQISIPVSSALSGCYFFEAGMEMTNLITAKKGTVKSSNYYREKLHRYALGDLSETKIHDISQQLLVPGAMSQEAFDTWWEEKAPETSAAPKKRSLGDARSMLELQLLTKDIPAEELSVSAEDAAKLSRLFTNIRPGMTPKDLELHATCMATLAGAADTEVLSSMVGGLRGKLPFFPQDVMGTIPLKNLEIWGRLPVRQLDGFMKVVFLLYSPLEIAKLSMHLPLRCITIIFEKLSLDDISAAVFAADFLRSDVILAIWKNKKYPKELRNVITMANTCRALSEEGLPKEWTAAQRELKRNLFEKPDFQEFVLANAGSNLALVINPIQRMRNMAAGECQSLLVKLARHSAELKAHIEGGKGKELLAAQDISEPTKQNETPMTSLKSYKELQDELDNIIKVQVPENNKAIEIARGFGDFRENAEYDAAKERRRFLQRRRSELERLVATVQPINFLEFKADTSKISMGTEVVLQDDSGAEKTYSIVGAWDGNPDQNRISYKTKIGETILGAKVGDSLTLPDGTKATVKSIAPLNADLAKELSPAE